MLPPIKTRLRFFARQCRIHLQATWDTSIGLEEKVMSSYKRFIVPILRLVVSFYQILCVIFQKKKTIDDPETTPLLINADIDDSTADLSVFKEPLIRAGVPSRPLRLNLAEPWSEPPMTGILRMPYIISPYCVLCRRTIPTTHLEAHLPASSVENIRKKQHRWWDWNIMGIFPIALRAKRRYVAVAIDLLKHTETVVTVDNTKLVLDIKFVKLSDTSYRDDLLHHARQEAFVVHRLCRNLVTSKVNVPSLHKVIHQYGQATPHGPGPLLHTHLWDNNLHEILPFLEGRATDTPLRAVLRLVARLPTELRTMTRTRVKRHKLSPVIDIIISALPLLQQTQPPSISNLILHKTVSFIRSNMITVYGSAYLNHVEMVTPTGADDITSLLKLKCHGIHGVRIAIGDYGIGVLAFALLYHDGSTSQWIGGIVDEQHPYQTILGQEVRGLKLHHDCLKIVKVEILAKRTWYISHDMADDPMDNQKRKLFPPMHHADMSLNYMLPISHYDLDASFSSWRSDEQMDARKRNFHNWQLGTHAALIDDGGKSCKSITVYCLSNSVTGILVKYRETQGDQQRPVMLGVRKAGSVAVHLELSQSERITSICTDQGVSERECDWIKNRCPPILITTSRRRTLLCSQLPSSNRFRGIETTESLVGSSPEIIGLFSDGTLNPDGSIRNLGVTYRKQSPSSSETAEESHVPTLLHSIALESLNCGSFWSSTASLSDVAMIEMWKRGCRVLGLKIQHAAAGTFEILGQFDPCFPNETSILFDQKLHGDLVGMDLEYGYSRKVGWGDHDAQYVKKVNVSSAFSAQRSSQTMASSENTVSVHICDSITWLFNAANDLIQLPNGTLREAEVEHVQRKQLLLNPGLGLPERALVKDYVLWDEHEGEDDWE